MLNTFPELSGYAIEYVTEFSTGRGLEVPNEDPIAIGMWAAYEDTDVQQWIDYLDEW